MGTLILVRHGQSQWNLENRFTGWTDVDVTATGKNDATLTGKSLRDYNFDIVFLSRLKRTEQTFLAIEEGYGKTITAPRVYDSALNERHYGDLQGLNKADTIQKYGEEQVKQWRRSFSVRPPNGESIEDCIRRTLPFYKQYIVPHIEAGKTVLVVAHGNSLRPIYRELDQLNDEATAGFEIPLVLPTMYFFEAGKAPRKQVHTVPGMEVKSTANIK
jgi:2,3-bisphosphoglycerate-dependent phosphoglycerate mutase